MARAPIISPNIRVRYRESFTVGEGSIIDEFCYFSTRIRIGRYCHVANNCSVAGGPNAQFTLGDFSGVSAGARIWCSTADYTRDVLTIFPTELGPISEHMATGDVTFERLTGLGTNSVVLPDNHVPEGAAIGAMSFVPPHYEFEPWTVYFGIPIRPVYRRDRESVLRQLALVERKLAELETP